MLRTFKIACFAMVVFAGVTFAEVPVEDATSDNDTAAAQAMESDNASASVVTNANGQQIQQPLVAVDSADNQPAYATAPQQMNVAASSAAATHSSNDVILSTAGMPLPQRVSRLEEQFNNIQRMHLIDQVNNLQQQLQDLQGRADVTAHQLKVLQAQQQSFYQDMDSRLTKMANGGVMTGSSSVIANNATATSPANANPNQAEDFLKDQQAYEAAAAIIKTKKYSAAISAMNNYLKNYPQGHYTINAHYWLGELYMISGDNTNAKLQFSTVVQQYPNQPKVADALLKLGMLDYEGGRWNDAKLQFTTVVKDYPATPSARVAQEKLKQMAQADR